MVLEPMRFVDNEGVPFDGSQLSEVISNQHFGRGDENIDHPSSFPLGRVPFVALLQILAIHGNRIRLVFVVGHLEFTNVVPILRGSVIDNRIEVGPTRKLTVPMGDRRERGHDEEGSCSTQFSRKGIDENCSLDCLTQTHLKIIF